MAAAPATGQAVEERTPAGAEKMRRRAFVLGGGGHHEIAFRMKYQKSQKIKPMTQLTTSIANMTRTTKTHTFQNERSSSVTTTRCGRWVPFDVETANTGGGGATTSFANA